MCIEKGHDGVFGLPAGLEDRLLIGKGQLLEEGILETDTVEDAAIIQNFPVEGRPHEAKQTERSVKEILKFLGTDPDAADQDDTRIKICLGDADAGALGG